MSSTLEDRLCWRSQQGPISSAFRTALFPALACTLALSLFAIPGSAAKRQVQPICREAPVGVSQTRFARDGNVLVRLSDGTIRKYARDGRVLWEVTLMSPKDGPQFSPYSFDLDGPDVVLVGVSPLPGKRPEAALYRLEGDAPTARRVKPLPGWLPGGITVAPDGTLFVVALSARRVNGVLAASAPGITVTDYSIHQLDRDGNLLQSLVPVAYSTDSAFEFSKKMGAGKVLFSPSGQAYFYSQNEPVLSKLNLDTGELEGSMPLPFGGFAKTVYVPTLEFVSDSEVVYSLFQTQEDDRVLGSQIRTLNLVTGHSELLSSTGPDTMMDFGQYDPVSRSIQALSLRFDQPLGQGSFQLRRLTPSSERTNRR